MNQTPQLPIEITVSEVAALRKENAPFFLLDCREPGEYELVHIEGATLLPMSEIAGRVGELEGRKNERIVVQCHHGGRSLRVANWLKNQGFSQVQSMKGGIDAWASEIDPSLPKY